MGAFFLNRTMSFEECQLRFPNQWPYQKIVESDFQYRTMKKNYVHGKTCTTSMSHIKYCVLKTMLLLYRVLVISSRIMTICF